MTMLVSVLVAMFMLVGMGMLVLVGVGMLVFMNQGPGNKNKWHNNDTIN